MSDGTHKCGMCNKDVYPAIVSAVKKQFMAREASELIYPADPVEVECSACGCMVKVTDITVLNKLKPKEVA